MNVFYWTFIYLLFKIIFIFFKKKELLMKILKFILIQKCALEIFIYMLTKTLI